MDGLVKTQYVRITYIHTNGGEGGGLGGEGGGFKGHGLFTMQKQSGGGGFIKSKMR